MNSFANWIAAVGTVFTAALALWLAVRDRRVTIDARLTVGLVPGADRSVLDQRVFVLSFTNSGVRPVTVTNHSWSVPFVKGVIFMFPNLDPKVGSLCTKLPVELTDGKSGHSFYPIDHFASLEKPETVLFHPNALVAWLRIRFFRVFIQTSVGKSVHVKVDAKVRQDLWRQYRDA